MGFFSNIIKKVGGFIASVFRDVEKPIEKIEEVFEEPKEEVIKAEKIFYRKIVKTGDIESDKKGNTEVAWYYKKPISLYAVTYEDNLIDRREFLINILKKEFGDYELPITYFEIYGYDQEQTTTKPPFEYENYEVKEEL